MKVFNKKILASAIAASIAATGSSFSVLAEDEENKEDDQVIVVSANRRNESIQDIAYNISAVTGEDLVTAGIRDQSDLFRTTAGVVFVDQGSRSGVNNSNLIIRGINSEELSRASGPMSTAPVVSTYINETPLFVNLRLKDIDRVEVLRGPQGTLYGSGSLGGSVRYIYNKPDANDFEGKVSGGISSTENGYGMNYETDVMLNIPLTDDLAIRLNGGWVDNAGFIDQSMRYVRNNDGTPVLDNGSTDPFGDAANFYAGQPVFESIEGANTSETTSARIALKWAPSATSEINMSYHQQSDESGGLQMISPATYGDSLQNAALIAEPFERDVDILSIDGEFDMGFASFTASASSYTSEGSGQRDLTGFYELFGFYESYYGTSPRPLIEDTSSFDEQADVFELRLVSQGNSTIEWVVGAYFMEQDTSLSVFQDFPGYDDYANACFAATGTFGGAPCGFGTLWGVFETNGPVNVVKDEAYFVDQRNSFTDTAIFGEVTWNVSDELKLTAGFRSYDQEFDTTQVGGLEFVPDAVATRSLNSNDTGNLFKFNGIYSINESTNVYAVLSEGFRRGGANGIPDMAFGFPVNDKTFLYDSDTTQNTEVGIKGSLDNGFRYNLSYYDVSWENMQSNLSCTGLGLLCVINVGEASSSGIEAELSGSLSDNLDIRFTYTYNDSELDTLSDDLQEFLNDGTSFVSINPGVRLPGSSENSFYMGANYYQDLENGLMLTYGLNGSFKGEARSGLESSSMMLDSFWIWNANLRLEGEDWTAVMFINNLSDERAILGADSPDLWGSRAGAIITSPRIMGVSLSYSF